MIIKILSFLFLFLYNDCEGYFELSVVFCLLFLLLVVYVINNKTKDFVSSRFRGGRCICFYIVRCIILFLGSFVGFMSDYLVSMCTLSFI